MFGLRRLIGGVGRATGMTSGLIYVRDGSVCPTLSREWWSQDFPC